jgi:DNA-directed RNA polymerase specialized sigma24 family protein
VNKTCAQWFTALWVSQEHSPSGSFEELAPLFDRPYNVAYWLTTNPKQAEDLAQETSAKALKAS